MNFKFFIILCFVYYLLRLLQFDHLNSQDDGKLIIYMFDVGQGDSLLIKTPHNKYILVDGGDNYDVDYHIFNTLPGFRCSLDLIIVTHPHKDHLFGVNRLLQHCNVKEVLHVPVDYTSYVFDDFKRLLATKHVASKPAYQGDVFTIDSVTLYFIWPSKAYIKDKGYKNNINDTSIAFLLDYKDVEALFLGDIEITAQKYLNILDIKKYMQDNKLEFYKVSHHGSINGTLNALVLELNPVLAGISVGKNNKFRHPSPDIIDFFMKNNIEYFRTDLMGTLKLSFL